MADTWSYCSTCQRWYYLPADGAGPDPGTGACPVCAEPSRERVDRGAAPVRHTERVG